MDAILPDEIGNPFLVRDLLDIEANLRKVSHCEGFNNFLKNSVSDFDSWRFVLDVAGDLFDLADCLKFEPPIAATGKKADLRLEIGTEPVIVECKSPHFSSSNPNPIRHAELNLLARKILPPGCQIHFLYKEDRGDLAFRETFSIAAEKIILGAEPGVLFENDWMIARREPDQANTPGADKYLLGIVLEHSGIWLRGTGFYEDGYTFVFCGPLTEVKKSIKKKVKRSATQADKDYPFLSIINSTGILGDRSRNFSSIQSEYSANMNTRISGVLYFQKFLTATGMRTERKFIPNPHAAKQLPQRLEADLHYAKT